MHTQPNHKTLKEILIEYSEDSPMREACGFICSKDDDFYFQEAVNHSTQDDTFLIKPMDYIKKKSDGDLVAIFHTHLEGSSDPSKRDLDTSKNLLMPFAIYSLEDENFSLFSQEDFEVDQNCVKRLREKLAIND
jgi:proteasome lid subunit RPN8/RPN11